MTWSSRRRGGIRCRRCGGPRKSVRTLARELSDQGHPVSPSKVGQLLAQLGYSLQAPAKEVEGGRPSRPRCPGSATSMIRPSCTWRRASRSLASTPRRRCDTRSHVASGLADRRSGLCRLRSSGLVLDGLAPPLTCVAGNGGVRSSRESRRTPVPSGGYGQGADRTGELREPLLMSRYA